MARRIPTDEMLMALADDALEKGERQRLMKLVEADAALTARLEAFRQSRQVVADAYKPLSDAPVPESLQKAVRGLIAGETGRQPADVVAFPARRQQPASSWFKPTAIAASVAIVAAGLGGYLAGHQSGATNDAVLVAAGGPAPQALSASLNSVPSGAEARLGADRLRMISSVILEDGALCREFEVDSSATSQTLAALACRRAGQWQVQAVISAPAEESGFAPASALSALDGYLQALGAGEALPAAQEEEALKRQD